MSLMVFFCYLMVPPSCMVLDGPFYTPSHPSSSKPASSKAQAVSGHSVPHLLVLLGDPLLSREEPGFLTAVFQGQVLQGHRPHSFHEHRLGILNVPEVLEVVPGVGGMG